jgi:hypothetical protein
MTVQRRARALATLTAVTLTVAACGSTDTQDDSDAFKRAYAAQSVELKAIGDEILAAIRGADGQTDAQVAATFGALATRARASADVLDGLVAPDDARSALTRLQGAVGRAAGDLDAITTAARAGDAAAAMQASQALVTDSSPIRDARAALDRVVEE